MSGQPFIKFYGSDWRADTGLRLCSAAARGVWMDAISIMMEAEPHGFLLVDGKPVSPEDFGGLTNTPAKVVKAAWNELDARNVWSRDGNGTPFSRRLVRDKAKLEAAREAGKTGGNPTLKGGGNGQDKPPTKPPDNHHPNGILNHPDKVTRESQKPEARYQRDSDEQRSHSAAPRGRPQSGSATAVAGIVAASSRARGDG